MTTKEPTESADMRRDANRLRHAMKQLHALADQVDDRYRVWSDHTRRIAEKRVDRGDSDDVLTDPIYTQALDASPTHMLAVVHAWHERMTAELDAWRTRTQQTPKHEPGGPS